MADAPVDGGGGPTHGPMRADVMDEDDDGSGLNRGGEGAPPPPPPPLAPNTNAPRGDG